MGTFVQQFKATVWRNGLIKIRTKKYLFLEIFMPLYFVGILALIQNTIPETTLDAIPEPQPSAQLSSSIPHLSKIAVAPGSPEIHNLFDNIPLSFNVTYFTHEDIIIDTYVKQNYTGFDSAIIFDSEQLTNFSYSIYFPPEKIPKLKDIYAPERNCRQNPFDESSILSCDANKYYFSGFTQLQELVDEALLRRVSNARNDPVRSVTLTLFPKDKSVTNMQYLRSLVPIYIVLAFSPFVTYVVILIVGEKEKKIKECMKIMGLKDSVYWLSWLAVYSAYCVFLAIMTSGLLKVAKVLPKSDVFLIFITLFFYGLSVVTMAYMITPFFSKAKVAGTVTSLSTLIFSSLYYLNVYLQGISPVYYWLMCLLSPTALALGIDNAVKLEVEGAGLTFSNVSEGSFSFANVIIMLIVDTILYAILAYYLDNVIPGEYGTRQSPLFCFSAKFWFPDWKRNRSLSTEQLNLDNQTDYSADAEENNSPDIEPVPVEMEQKVAVKVFNLKKGYKKGSEVIMAVNDVSLRLYEGEITALLGHNGAGKTTFLNMLLGLIPPTAGTASVCGMDITDYNDLTKIREMTGICPQENVLFDNLTPVEHLKFYGMIKGIRESTLTEKIDKILTDVGLSDVKSSKSGTLSGGQKRKLQVAIAIIGDPKIIILDEPTSGVDPYSRRSLWTLLQNFKAGKVILLTTHFMDEADILADRKAILSKGKLRCVGSSLFLKNKFGLGYHLVLVVGGNYDADSINNIILKHIPKAIKSETHGQEVSYILPLVDVNQFPSLFKSLDIVVQKQEFGVESYGMSMTTLEEVFLKLGDDEDILSKSGPTVAERIVTRSLSRQESIASNRGTGVGTTTINVNDNGNLSPQDQTTFDRPRFYDSFQAILKIRFLNILRLPKNIWSTIVAPIVFLVISSVLLKNQVTTGNDPTSLKITPSMYADSNGLPPVLFNLSHDEFSKFNSSVQAQNIQAELYNGAFKELLSNKPHTFLLDRLVVDKLDEKVTLLYNDTAVHSLPAILNLLNNIRLNLIARDMDLQLTAKTFPTNKVSSTFDGNTLASSILIGIIFVSIQIPLVMDTIDDRETKVKHLLRVNGLSFGVYWSSFFVCHMLLMLISLLIMMIMVVAFQIPSLTNSGALLSLFLTYFLFLPSGLVFYYCIGFLFKKQENAESVIPFVYIFGGLLPYLAVSLVDSLMPTENTGHVLHYIFVFVLPLYPPFATLYFINKIYMFNSILGITPQMSDYFENEVAITMISCVFNFILYSIILRICEAVTMGESVKSIFKAGSSETIPVTNYDVIDPEDSDVKEERSFVESYQNDGETPVVLVNSLRKVYNEKKKSGLFSRFKKNESSQTPSVDAEKVAVRNLSLLIKKGEVFGLLGPNGAGKTTTLRIIVTDEVPSAGKVSVAGFDVTSNLEKVFESMGYCPQHDAQWKNITLKEHLMCYAAIRGVPKDQISNVVNQFIETLHIEEHSSKQSKDLSGGTQRKLSYGISMLGNSKVVMLDEPSTGMDPQSKRYLWNTITSSFQGKRGAILTTHSMEEADVLCTRVGIMVKGALRCLGSTQHLKNKHGGGYVLELKLASSRDGNEAKLENFVKTCFPDSERQEFFGGRFKYNVPQRSVTSLAEIFKNLEEAKTTIGISEYSFSQTTLEQVFLEFARQQEEESQ